MSGRVGRHGAALGREAAGWLGRMPMWPAGTVAALAMGVLIGGRLAMPTVSEPGSSAHAESFVRLPAARAVPPVVREREVVMEAGSADSVPVMEWVVVDGDAFGVDGGEYVPPSGTSTPMPYRAFTAAPDSAVGSGSAAVEVPAERVVSKPAPRTRPVQSASAAAAAMAPLLIRPRGGDRVVFYEMSGKPPVIAGGMKGDWAVPGACGVSVRLDFEQGGARFGAVRGVGRHSGELARDFDLVVPAHACSVAGSRLSRPRSGSTEVRDGAWVWSADGNRVSLRGASATEPAVVRDVNGVARLIGVYRRGAVREGWYAVTEGRRLTELVRVWVDGPNVGVDAAAIAGG